MKKLFLILTLPLLAMSAMFSETKVYDGNYTIPCEQCKKITLSGNKAGHSYCTGCPMWRRFDLEVNHFEYKWDSDKKGYRLIPVDKLGSLVYRCQHGHILVVK